MVKKIVNHAGSNVAQSNKVRADHLPLRMTVKTGRTPETIKSCGMECKDINR